MCRRYENQVKRLSQNTYVYQNKLDSLIAIYKDNIMELGLCYR